MEHPDDYRLERWLAVLFSLLFLLPVVADAQPLAPVEPSRPGCQVDVTSGNPLLESEPDVNSDAPVLRSEMSIRVAASEREPSC